MTTKKAPAKTAAKPKRRRKAAPKADAKKSPASNAPFFIVGIGSSAGGLEALRPLVANLPLNAPMAYVLVQHMAPQYRSMMGELLSRETKVPVMEITDKTKVTPNKVFITPPNHDVEIRKGVLYLKPPANPVGPKPSVDNFFSSLAEDQGENAIGVILSGTGSDGALGMRAIKAHGGFTLVQDPENAKYNGMPLSAIETNLIDLILTPDKIGRHLPEIVQTPGKMMELLEDERSGFSSLDEIFAMVRKRTDIDFSKYKQTTLCRRIERRIIATQTQNLSAYVTYMREHVNEAESLAQDVLIGVTGFYRDPESFKALGRTLDEIIDSKSPGDEIRIWIAGCSTGEEAYTMAILLTERLGKKLGSFKIQIFATDIDMEALERARKGIFLETQLRDVPEEILERYFTQKGDKFYISKDLRELVVFARQDLSKDPPFVRVDLLTCRNVLIYFNQELQDRVFASFHFALNATGFMFLGKSEALGQSTELFEPLDTKHRIYSKKTSMVDRLGRMPLMDRPKAVWPNARPTEQKKVSVEEAMRSTIMRVYAPKSLMVEEDGSVLQISGDVTGYMVLGSGKGDLNVTRMLIPELRGEFWSLFSQVKKSGDSARGSVKSVEIGGARKGVRMGIHPTSRMANANAFYLIGFEEFDIPEKQSRRQEDGQNASDIDVDVDESRVPELEQELVATKEHLQTVIEELETSNEELQALNEELQASNEEMQSTNEELETANEELQSTNEELTTVNEELQTRTTELMVANADMENMQRNIGYSIIIVDSKMRVKRFSPTAVRFFGLAPEDIGEGITTIPSHVNIQNLKQKISKVVSSGGEYQEDILTEKLALWLRIVPYHTMANKVEGAVIVIIDQSEIHGIRRALNESEKLQRLVSDSLPMGVALVGSDQRVVQLNRNFNNWFGMNQNLIGKKIFTVFGRKIHDQLKPALEKVAAGESVEIELEHAPPELEKKTFRVMLEPRLDEMGKKVEGFLILFDDLTELHAARRESDAAKERYRTLSEAGLQGILVHRKGKPVYINHVFARIFGYADPEEIHALPGVNQLLTEKERKRGYAKSTLFGSGHASGALETAGLGKSGAPVEVIASSRVVEWDGELSIQTAVVPLNGKGA